MIDSGSAVAITATAPTPATGERYISLTWTGTGIGSYAGTGNPAIVTMDGPITETAGWTKQYHVTFAVSPRGGNDHSFGKQCLAGRRVPFDQCSPVGRIHIFDLDQHRFDNVRYANRIDVGQYRQLGHHHRCLFLRPGGSDDNF